MKQEIFQKAKEITLRYENIQPEEVKTVRLPKELTDRLEVIRNKETGLEWPMWAVISSILETFIEEHERNNEIRE